MIERRSLLAALGATLIVTDQAKASPMGRGPRYQLLKSTGGLIDVGGRTWSVQGAGKSYGVQTASNFDGVVRFECRSGDRRRADKKIRERVELSSGNTPMSYDQENWIAFSRRVWLPPGGFRCPDAVLGQVHNSNERMDTGVAHPMLAFRVRRDGSAVITTSGSAEQPLKHASEVREVHRGRQAWNTWEHFVVRAIWRPVGGELQIWRNGAEIVNRRDLALGFIDAKGPYFKWGIYRASYPETLVVEYACVMMGAASLEAMIRSPPAVPA
jgi:hypothetical protein